MKNIALLIAVVGSVVFFRGIAFADDAARMSQAKKTGEQISSAMVKTAQPHNALSAPAKSSLPVNAGQKHGLAAVGGANAATARKSGTINGTEVKRRP
jgi:hypothetical protein